MVRERLALGVALLALAAQVKADVPLAETTLPLRLMGTVVAADTARSIAVVENDGARVVAHVGDAIGVTRVQEIRKDGLVLASEGRLTRLSFATAAAATAAGRTVGVASAQDENDTRDSAVAARDWRRAASERRARAAAKAHATRATAVPANAATEDEDTPDASSGKPLNSQELLAQLANQARYAPYHDEAGKLHGVALMNVRPDSTLERIGLRSGDVVVSIAGVKVDNTSKAFDALRSINPRAGGEVLVERGGVPTRIAVPPGAL